jgi:hypothetical protein
MYFRRYDSTTQLGRFVYLMVFGSLIQLAFLIFDSRILFLYIESERKFIRWYISKAKRNTYPTVEMDC